MLAEEVLPPFAENSDIAFGIFIVFFIYPQTNRLGIFSQCSQRLLNKYYANRLA